MNLIDFIPIGREHKKTRQELMYEAKIPNESEFQKELAELRQQYIIKFDNGYYIPSSKKEYLDFIQKQNKQLCETSKTIELAYRGMEELEKV